MARSFHVLALLLAATLGWVTEAKAQDWEAAHERVLIPISVSYVPGAYGSMWSTELYYRNNSSYPVEIDPQTSSDYTPTIGLTVLWPTPLEPPETPGVFLFITRGYANEVTFDLRMYNRADPFGEWGTKLPVVRETQFADAVELINVGTGPAVRTALRIYGLSDDPTVVTINIYRTAETGDELLASSAVQLQGKPRYYGILSLADMFPAIRGKASVRVNVTSNTGTRIWAFATVTSNVSQHVGIVAPD